MAKKNQITTSDYLTMKEFRKLLAGLRKDKKYVWELYVRISFYTALRISDVMTLTWEDVLHKGFFTKTEKKTGKTRRIPFSENTIKHIEELYILLKRPNPAHTLISKPNGSPYCHQYINRQIKMWKEQYKINIGNFSTHTFRKTFGRYVYDKAKDKSEALILLNGIFRHANLTTTKIYIGLREDEIKSVFHSIEI